MINLIDIDINLLNLFKLLYEKRNIKEVASILNVSQSAISHSMKRLRVCLNDQLFYSTSSGLSPTTYAESISVSIINNFNAIEKTINSNTSFMPLSSHKVFNVSMTDVGEILFLPKLMSYLSEVAPNISIEIVRCDSTELKKKMELGKIDIAIGLLPELNTGFYQRSLFKQQYKLMMRKDHPLLSKKITEKLLFKYKHVAIISKDSGHSIIEKFLQNNHINRNVIAKLTHFIALPYMLSISDFIATVPEKLGTITVDNFNITTVEHPLSLPEIQVNIFWHSRSHKDIANQWLRKLIFDMFSEY